MHILQYHNSAYSSPERQSSWSNKIFPSTSFYCRVFFIVAQAAGKVKRGTYDGTDWGRSSYEVLQEIEKIGVRLEITGIDHVKNHNRPAIIIGNHMSMMETLLLPAIIQPFMDVTFVIKESLLNYPVFKHVMRSRDPVAVGRTNPRQDLKVVMTEGKERLGRGLSVIVFPQTTRSHTFDPKQMSSIGVKLARKAEVSVIPLALKTDGWQNGTMIKDFGKIDTTKTAYFSFGEPMEVSGKGNEEQQAINDFIVGKLEDWED